MGYACVGAARAQLCTDALLGPAGVRALCAALLGSGADMKQGPYAPLKSLRLWRVDARDAGASAVGDLLRLGGEGVVLTCLEMMDCRVGPLGCLALGEALMAGANRSLLTLILGHNATMGDEGAVNLAKGLRTNATITVRVCGLRVCLVYVCVFVWRLCAVAFCVPSSASTRYACHAGRGTVCVR